MEPAAVRKQITLYLKKYRYGVVILLVGLLLMALPEKKTEQPPVLAAETAVGGSLQEELSQILSRIQGAGKVEVLLTEYAGAQTIYQTDLDQKDSDLRRDTVILSGENRGEAGLVSQVNPPIYQGALIVCQGGDRPAVKLAIVQAVMSVTGLSSNQITVLKMK